ncbi:hypothetical protein MC885_001511, partial [Smutsia gigantea]
ILVSSSDLADGSHGPQCRPELAAPPPPGGLHLNPYARGVGGEPPARRGWASGGKGATGAPRRRAYVLIFSPVAPALHCSKGISVSIEEHRGSAFNWTTERVETCDNGTFCQESALLIRAGAKAAVLATKGCISEGLPEMTSVQHSPPPGITTVSYSSYCEESLCNNREDLSELWKTREIPDTWEASSGSATLHCPTCVALGTCPSAPSLPCPNGTTQCYHGRLQVIGGGISSPLEVKGCSSVAGCRLMSGVFTVGPMWVKEMCPYQSPIQPQKIESGVPRLPVSVWRLVTAAGVPATAAPWFPGRRFRPRSRDTSSDSLVTGGHPQ